MRDSKDARPPTITGAGPFERNDASALDADDAAARTVRASSHSHGMLAAPAVAATRSAVDATASKASGVLLRGRCAANENTGKSPDQRRGFPARGLPARALNLVMDSCLSYNGFKWPQLYLFFFSCQFGVEEIVSTRLFTECLFYLTNWVSSGSIRKLKTIYG